MIKTLTDTPTHLSGITFGSGETISLKIGWDFVYESFKVFPLIHLFDKTGKRLDIISVDKTSSQGIQLTQSRGSHFEFDLNMKKFPSYIDSFYLSLGCEKPKKLMRNIKDLYVQLNQGKESELWGVKELDINSSTAAIAAIERKDASFDPGSLNKWNFNFILSSIPPDYLRIYSVLSKDNLFNLPEIKLNWWDRIRCKIIDFISKLF